MTESRGGAGASVLLTGSTGFIGKVVLHELVRRRAELGIERVYLLVRRRGSRSAADRFRREVATSGCFTQSAAAADILPALADMCEAVDGDIRDADLGLAPADARRLHDSVTHVIHCAASVRFDDPLEQAARVNVTGALNVLEFARGCRRLQRFVDVSTAYVTPHTGSAHPVEEAPVALPFDADVAYADILAGRADADALLAATRHPNTYTFTKCLAEALLVARQGDVPLSIVRPSTVSVCRQQPFAGWIDSEAAHAAVAARIAAGDLRVMRMDPSTVLDIVPCDVVADRILACAFSPELQRPLVIRHAVAGLALSLPLARVLAAHVRWFSTNLVDRRVRVVYAGSSAVAYRLFDAACHRLPRRMRVMRARLQGRRSAARRLENLGARLRYLNRTFHHFAHHTYDFRTAFPPLEGFDLRTYLDCVSAGIARHLMGVAPES
ncbi:MAG TPA: fatty acyl-CoA reductase [Longimicrobiales bacterium]|nr:fatty acyl-CoA reductase [Longimicrobiales bacterium]